MRSIFKRHALSGSPQSRLSGVLGKNQKAVLGDLACGYGFKLDIFEGGCVPDPDQPYIPGGGGPTPTGGGAEAGLKEIAKQNCIQNGGTWSDVTEKCFYAGPTPQEECEKNGGVWYDSIQTCFSCKPGEECPGENQCPPGYKKDANDICQPFDAFYCGENQVKVYSNSGEPIGCQCAPGYEWEDLNDPNNDRCVKTKGKPGPADPGKKDVVKPAPPKEDVLPPNREKESTFPWKKALLVAGAALVVGGGAYYVAKNGKKGKK